MWYTRTSHRPTPSSWHTSIHRASRLDPNIALYGTANDKRTMWLKRECLQDSSRLDEVVDMWLSRTHLDGDIRKNDPFCAHLGCFFCNWSGTPNWLRVEEHCCKLCQWLQSNYWKSSPVLCFQCPHPKALMYLGAFIQNNDGGSTTRYVFSYTILWKIKGIQFVGTTWKHTCYDRALLEVCG